MQKDLKEKTINYENLIYEYPWIKTKGQKCIISPDSDGMLCGLLMSSQLNWKVKGFYDGKILLIDKNTNPDECIFLDIEIFRKNIRSIGHHMVNYRCDQLPSNWKNFENSIQANNLRDFDFKHNFKEKYPFGTIHLLLAILGSTLSIPINEKGLGYLLYTDGTFKNIFNYPDNSLSWLKYLKAEEKEHILYKIFYAEHTVMNLMENLSEIFTQLRGLNNGKRGADKIYLTKNSNGTTQLRDVEKQSDNLYMVSKEARILNSKFLSLLGEITGWRFNQQHWQYNNFILKQFIKSEIKANQKKYFELLAKNPISLAITTTTRVEYTIEGPDKLQ